MKRLSLIAIALLGLSACGSGGSSGPDRPATITLAEAEAYRTEVMRVVDLPVTENVFPAGEVTYTGGFTAPLLGLDSSEGVRMRTNVVGDIVVNVNFDDGEANGVFNNMNMTTREAVPIEKIDGELRVSGTEVNGEINMTGGGDITFTGPDGNVGTSTVLDLLVYGDVRTDVEVGVSMRLRMISLAAEGDFDFELRGTSDGLGYGAALTKEPTVSP